MWSSNSRAAQDHYAPNLGRRRGSFRQAEDFSHYFFNCQVCSGYSFPRLLTPLPLCFFPFIDSTFNNKPGNWPELLPFMFQCCNSENPSLRESALDIFSNIPDIFGDSLPKYIGVLKEVFQKAIADSHFLVVFLLLFSWLHFFLKISSACRWIWRSNWPPWKPQFLSWPKSKIPNKRIFFLTWWTLCFRFRFAPFPPCSLLIVFFFFLFFSFLFFSFLFCSFPPLLI